MPVAGREWMERSVPRYAIDESPLATVREVLPAAHMLSDGPVRYLLVAGDRDDGTWGSIGAFWRAIDGGRGGFLISPDAIWAGSEMVRCWQSNVGVSGRLMIDPQQHADTLFQVARRVGAI